MVANPQTGMTVEEYLAFERASETKHEYIDGEVLAMAGASFAHNLIVGNTIIGLGPQLRRGPCRVLPSDMRVLIEATGLFTYPDLTILCGQPLFGPDQPDTLLNPTALIEVLSPSTEAYDRGRKFQQYRSIPTLREYVLIAQDAYRIEHFARQEGDLWLFSEATDTEASLTLPALNCTLTLADVYAGVTLPAGESGAALAERDPTDAQH